MKSMRGDTRSQVSMLLLLLAGALAACGAPPDVELPLTIAPTPTQLEPSPIPTPDSPPPQTLFICLGREPESLYRFSASYLYGDTSREADAVLEAIYDGPLDVLGYAYQAVILEKLPDLADGDAQVLEIEVREGEVYFNPTSMLPENLAIGSPYLPAGCREASCIRTYRGGSVSMERMEVDFELLEGLSWSDGQALLAKDSVFTFELDRHKDTPTPKIQVERTASYSATSDRSVRWIGIPGYLDPEYYANFWSPLPEHILGDFSPGDLLAAPEVNIMPLGWGPYRIEEWKPGQYISLVPNGSYHRAEEGLPHFDRLVYRFLEDDPGSSVDQLLTRECDVLDDSAVVDALAVETLDPSALEQLLQLQQSGIIELSWTSGALMERMDFNLANYASGATQPLFGDVRMRQAIAACLDREALVEQVLFGLGQVPDSYLPPAHPRYDDVAGFPAYDPVAASDTLESLGWRDTDEDPGTPREAVGVAGMRAGTPLRFTYLTTPGGFHQATAEHLQTSLAQCGIELRIEYVPREELYLEWPNGPVFGGGFESVGWAWPGWVSPFCEMFARSEIPSTDNPHGINAAGFRDQAYQEECSRLLLGLPGDPPYDQAVDSTQAIFRDELPSIPLYMHPRVIAHRPEICGVQVDPTAFSAFWNIEEIAACPH